MNMRHLIAASTAALAMALVAPAYAQNINDNTNTNTNTNNTQNNSTSSSDATATATANSNGVTTITDNSQDNSQDNDNNGNTLTDNSQDNDNNGNTLTDASQDNDFNGNSYSDSSQDNDNNGNTITVDDIGSNNGNDESEHYGNGSASRGGEVEADAENGSAASVNGDATNVDVEDVVVADDGSNAASQGGQVDTVASGDGSIAVSRGGEVEIGNVEDSNNQNGSIIADQDMMAIISNDGGMEAVVDDTNEGYRSGDNTVRGNAFAAFAGILNNAWNTGVNANTQAGTNIAAGATINFGDAAGGSCPGNSCH